MKKPYIVKKQLDKIGNTVYLTDGDWTSAPFCASVQPLWRRKSSAFEPEYTQIGTESREYYLYIGPYDHDITVLSDKSKVLFNDTSFCFTRRDAVKIGGETVYFTGILKKLKESELDEYECDA